MPKRPRNSGGPQFLWQHIPLGGRTVCLCFRHVRLVAWNCCSGGARKWGWVEELSADVAVICEGPRNSPRPTPTLLEPAVAWHAAGDLDHKHVAIGSSRLGSKRSRRGTARASGRWPDVSTAAPTSRHLEPPGQPSGASYAAGVTATLSAWADVLADGRMLVAGDFNVGAPIARAGQSATPNKSRERGSARTGQRLPRLLRCPRSARRAGRRSSTSDAERWEGTPTTSSFTQSSSIASATSSSATTGNGSPPAAVTMYL